MYSEPAFWKQAESQLIFTDFFFLPVNVTGRGCGCTRRKMIVLSHRFPGQGQLADKSCHNALGRLSTVSLVFFFFLRTTCLSFFHFSLCLLALHPQIW